jgi:3-hydroxyacyl-[acyl-carrier-protein] dehydratase
MEPGKSLVVTAELAEMDGLTAVFKGKGEVQGTSTVSARLILTRYNLRDRNPAWHSLDQKIIEHYRTHYAALTGELDARAAS